MSGVTLLHSQLSSLVSAWALVSEWVLEACWWLKVHLGVIKLLLRWRMIENLFFLGQKDIIAHPEFEMTLCDSRYVANVCFVSS